MITLPFTREQMLRAHAEWGANCGPAALAFALQVPIDAVRGKIPDFEAKRYTNPTMMRLGLRALGRQVEELPNHLTTASRILNMFATEPALVRVQFTGPWTGHSAMDRWAYKFTHWVVTWLDPVRFNATIEKVFDANAGVKSFTEWKDTCVPELTREIERADGGWYPTHVWRIKPSYQ